MIPRPRHAASLAALAAAATLAACAGKAPQGNRQGTHPLADAPGDSAVASSEGPKAVTMPDGWIRSDAKIRIRLHNLDTLPLENVFVRWPSDSARFPAIPAKGYSEYRAVDTAYRYAYVQAQQGRITWVCQPTDYVRETPLAPGRYTYELSKAGVMAERAAGMLRLELLVDKEHP
jgi:hypothetical protein